jgi:hypothetical protein
LRQSTTQKNESCTGPHGAAGVGYRACALAYGSWGMSGWQDRGANRAWLEQIQKAMGGTLMGVCWYISGSPAFPSLGCEGSIAPGCTSGSARLEPPGWILSLVSVAAIIRSSLPAAASWDTILLPEAASAYDRSNRVVLTGLFATGRTVAMRDSGRLSSCPCSL